MTGSPQLGEVEQDHAKSHQSGTELNHNRDRAIDYVHGVRYWAIGLVIASMFFLATMDMIIAATSLAAITDDLGNFDMASWVLTSYFLGYIAVIVVLAKLSDIFGRKLITIGCIVVFTLFSAGCAASQTLTQLIILRAFQGVGGGGSFALCTVLLIESEPPEKYADAVTRYGVAIVLALVLGPLLGGAISENTTWRWIFLINIPVGVVATIVALIGIPNGFPYHDQLRHNQEPKRRNNKSIWQRVDTPGTTLMLLATLSFTACFQEAGSRFSWGSAYVISLLIASGILWVALMIWERHVTLANKIREPVLPWRFFTHRETVGLFSGMILVGAPVAVTNFQLPQRFMLIYGMSKFDAAVRVLPFGASSAVGTMLSGKLASKFKVPSIYLVILGSLLQVVGFALLGTLDPSTPIGREIYGYQVVAALGASFSFANLIMLVAFTAEKRDGAVAMGAANQFRAMGSAIGLAIVTSVFNDYVSSQLRQHDIKYSLSTLMSHEQRDLPLELQLVIRDVLSNGYNRQMFTLCGFGAAQVFTAMLMWKRVQVVVAK